MFKPKHRNERRQAREAFWHEEGGRGHRGGGRRARLFVQGDLRLIMLDLIAGAPRHGYEIIKSVEEKVGGAYSPSPGVVYPTLALLEDMGFVTVRSTNGTRKLYAITLEGKAHLDANRATLDVVHARMRQSCDRRANAPQIERAVENLRVALRLRLERGLKDGESQAIADALDAAVKKIEQN